MSHYLVTLTNAEGTFTALCFGSPYRALAINCLVHPLNHFTLTMVHPMTAEEHEEARDYTDDEFHDDGISLYALTAGMPK